MATYGTDLTTLNDAESGSWYEFTATGWDVGDNPVAGDGDYFIQGQACATSDTNNKTGICSGAYDAGSDISSSFTSGVTVALIWHVLLPGNAMETYANNGLRVVVGASLTAFRWWAVGGRDVGRNPYGGWQNYAVDPSVSGTDVGGGHGGAYRYFGAATTVTSNISKGTMHGWDAIRYGRGEIYCTGTGCSFAGMAQYNDYNDATNGYNRFGLFQEQGVGSGKYLWKGLLSIGQSGTSATFSDSNKEITIDDTPAVYSTFNRLAIRNAGSSVTWDGISIKALGTTSRGELEVVENATFTATECSFQGMNTFTLLSNTAITNSKWKSCNEIYAGGASLAGSKVLTPTVAADSSAVIWNVNSDPGSGFTGMTYTIGSNAHHAIGFGTSSATTINLSGITFTGFNAANGQNDSTFYFADKGTDTVWTVNLSGCSGNFSYKKARAGDTVNITASVQVTFDKLKDNTEIRVYKTSDDSVIGGIENAVAGSPDNRNFTWSATASLSVYYHIINKQYEQITVYGYIVPSANTTINIAQRFDRNYSNPP